MYEEEVRREALSFEQQFHYGASSSDAMHSRLQLAERSLTGTLVRVFARVRRRLCASTRQRQAFGTSHSVPSGRLQV